MANARRNTEQSLAKKLFENNNNNNNCFLENNSFIDKTTTKFKILFTINFA